METTDITKAITKVEIHSGISKKGNKYGLLYIETIDKNITLEYFMDRKDINLLNFLNIK